MTRTAANRETMGAASAAPHTASYSGEVIYIFAYDIAYEMIRTPLSTLLGQPIAQFQVDTSKRTPRQLFFYRPQMVRLPALERIGRDGPLRLELSVKLLPVGALSITVRVPFANRTLDQLVEYHDLHFTNGTSLYDEVMQIVEDVRRELLPYLQRPVTRLADEEAYTVFYINAPLSTDSPQGGAEAWLAANRRQVAALLTEELDVAHLSDQEAEESTQKYLSYYDHDLVVVDWDAALIIDEPRYVDETLYLMELANLQLAELEAYDRILDDVIDRSYRDLSGRRSGRRTQRELREIRIDLARLSDELSNITKFFGDWHLARIYKALSDRFHLADWHRTIDEKLKTLGDLYQLLQADRNNRWMLILEITIVLLFIIDLLMLFNHGR